MSSPSKDEDEDNSTREATPSTVPRGNPRTNSTHDSTDDLSDFFSPANIASLKHRLREIKAQAAQVQRLQDGIAELTKENERLVAALGPRKE